MKRHIFDINLRRNTKKVWGGGGGMTHYNSGKEEERGQRKRRDNITFSILFHEKRKRGWQTKRIFLQEGEKEGEKERKTNQFNYICS